MRVIGHSVARCRTAAFNPLQPLAPKLRVATHSPLTYLKQALNPRWTSRRMDASKEINAEERLVGRRIGYARCIKHSVKAMLVIAFTFLVLIGARNDGIAGLMTRTVADRLESSWLGGVFLAPKQAAYNLVSIAGLLIIWTVARRFGVLSGFSLPRSMGCGRARAVLIGASVTAAFVVVRLTVMWLLMGEVEIRGASNEMLIGLSEEFAFRCIVFGALEGKRWWKGVFALVVSSLLFGGLHLVSNGWLGSGDPGRVMRQAVSACGGGLVYGGLRLALASMWPGVFVHAVFNLAPSYVPDEHGAMQQVKPVIGLPFIADRDVLSAVELGLITAFVAVVVRGLVDKGHARQVRCTRSISLRERSAKRPDVSGQGAGEIRTDQE